MEIALLFARLFLAAVFAVAGFGKLADRPGSRQALIGFGIPAPFAGPLAILLPLAELAVAVALLPAASARLGAVAALMLLLLFMVAIAINLALGRKPDCHCFGQIHSAPISWATLAQNAVLAGIAGLVVWQGTRGADLSVLGWLGRLTTGERVGLALGLILLALVTIEGGFLLSLLRQNGRILLRLDALEAALAQGGTAAAASAAAGLPVGTAAPDFHLPNLAGETLTLESLRATGKPVMMTFSDPDCGPCKALLPDMGNWQREHADKLTLALISRKRAKDNREAAEYGLTHILLQKDREVAEACKAVGTPTAVVVRPDATIGSPVAFGTNAIRSLLQQVVDRTLPTPATEGQGPATPTAPPVGEPAPSLTLPDLNGNPLGLAEFRGIETIVLFWNPRCGFCQRMLSDLKAWEANPPAGSPKLLVVSTGAVEENRAMGLRSPLVLDHAFDTGRSFGAYGTPSAVRVDGEGRVASELAVGAAAVLSLCQARQGLAKAARG
jgi:Peroxiredoxin